MADPQHLPPEVADALAKGHVIEAIKLLRQQRNLGLAEAKALVDAALQKQGDVKVNMKTNVRAVSRPAPRAGMERHPGLSPGEVPRRSTGAMIAVIFLLALVVIGAGVYLRLV